MAARMNSRAAFRARFNCGGTTKQVPEPASITLVGLGLLGAALARRRKPVLSTQNSKQFSRLKKRSSSAFVFSKMS